MWLSLKLLGLATPAAYHTAPWLTQNATAGGDRMADGGAKPDRSRNAADSIQWKFGVSNITKHLERAHSMKLKECSVFDWYNKVKLAARLTLKTAAPWQGHPVCFCDVKSRSLLLSLLSLQLGRLKKKHPYHKPKKKNHRKKVKQTKQNKNSTICPES